MEAGIKRPVTIAIGLAFVAACVVVLVWSVAPGAAPNVPPGMTEVTDPEELSKLMEISPPQIKTGSNFLGHRIHTMWATLHNISNSPIRLVDVKLTYRDAQKQVILQEIHPAFDPRRSPLEPGTNYRFEIAFETPPRTWNYHVPDTEIVRIGY